MTKYVIGPDVALRLAHDEAVIPDEHQLLAPTLLRSQMLALLYRAVRHGEMTKKDADRQLNYVRALRIRLLGDRVLQNVAWKVAGQLGWPGTFDAEYVAPTRLQAGALITLGRHLARTVKDLVTVAPIGALFRSGTNLTNDSSPGELTLLPGPGAFGRESRCGLRSPGKNGQVGSGYGDHQSG